ncbi:hypothetical protein CKO40_23655 [Halochromatium glycolicum]|uniref:Integrase catalytic domain-containing protein n=1 Tax=Halochromatium glycolicum TaxID=85075 RepID=A0AAJ0U8T1_9GAMM|nr:hypothetical protein [Halochromatium glycolicum]
MGRRFQAQCVRESTAGHVPSESAVTFVGIGTESLFRTLKYRPGYPVNGFADLTEARQWVLEFVRWYNGEHRHSQIRFVTPEQRHSGADVAILAQRQALYEQAKAERPERWSATTRDWSRPGAVTLNPAGANPAARPDQPA